MNFANFLHIVLIIGKYTDVFRGIFSGGREVRGMELREKIFPWGKIVFMTGPLNFRALIKKQ